jgi:hypothetical protein
VHPLCGTLEAPYRAPAAPKIIHPFKAVGSHIQFRQSLVLNGTLAQPDRITFALLRKLNDSLGHPFGHRISTAIVADALAGMLANVC